MLRSTSIRFAFAALFPLLCWAQLSRGTLTGVISDPSGAAVSGATITAKQQGHGSLLVDHYYR